MSYPWLAFLAFVAMIGAGALGLKRKRSSAPVEWVAHSQFMSSLPRYRHLVRRLKLRTYAYGLTVVMLVCTVALLAGAPSQTHTTNKKQINRDIILCLDVSGSMLPTDTEVVQQFTSIIDGFKGERVALNVWNYSGMTVFPLTDDYSMARKQLKRMDSMFSTAIVREDGVYVSEEALKFLKPTEDPNKKGASLIADGVAGCVLSFPRINDGRKRTLIVATDNQPQGRSIYTLPQSMELASKRHITVFGLYADTRIRGKDDPNVYDDSRAAQQKAEYAKAVQTTGGKLFDISDRSSVDAILRSITSSGTVVDKHAKIVTTVDDNSSYVWWLFIIVTVLLLGVGVKRR